MQLGMVGLGRMGANMTERLRAAGHDVKTFDPKVDSRTAGSLEELVTAPAHGVLRESRARPASPAP